MNNLIIMALPEEAPELAKRNDVFFTGIGKVNAASLTAELIERHKPTHIINFGTAGGITVGPGLYQVTRFVQRDMQCFKLDAKPGETPFETTPVVLDLRGEGLTCSTGDNFITDPNLEIPADLVDMESYAIAKICWRRNIRFSCYKFVSDQANEHAYRDWYEMMSSGQSYYMTKLQELNII
jgi:adenosylhomocysteine nucleosidase